MKRPSNRFTPTRMLEMLVPFLLGLLALGLLAVLVLIGASLIGWAPSG